MKLLDLIVCDDIRTERGDKVSLMGVFGDGIKLKVPKGTGRPIVFRLGVFIRVQLDESEPLPDHFEVRILSGDEAVGTFEGKISAQGRPRLLALPLMHGAIPISGTTTLLFHARFSSAGQVLLDTQPAFPLNIELVEDESAQMTELGNQTSAPA